MGNKKNDLVEERQFFHLNVLCNQIYFTIKSKSLVSAKRGVLVPVFLENHVQCCVRHENLCVVFLVHKSKKLHFNAMCELWAKPELSGRYLCMKCE